MNVKISPFCAEGRILASPCKSYAHRFLIAAALSQGRTVIYNIGSSSDVMRTVGCLSSLGAKIKIRSGNAEVYGIEKPKKNVILNVGESGSTFRFLLPVVCALGVSATFICGKSLINRPIGGLIDILTEHGAKIESVSGGYRVGGKITAGEYVVSDGVSSQYVSGLLFALPLLGRKSILTVTNVVSEPYIDMTLFVLGKFGISYKTEEASGVYSEKPLYKSIIEGYCRYVSCGKCYVNGDYSSSAAFFAFAAICGHVIVKGLAFDEQGDRAIISILNKMNCCVHAGRNFVSAKRKGVLIPLKYDFEKCPDLVPIVVALCAYADGVSELVGVERLKYKECDRLAACIKMCETAGVKTEYSDGVLKIFGGNPQTDVSKPAVFETFGDHRAVMAAAVLGAGLNREFIVEGADAVEKSCPEFWELFRQIGGKFDVEV